MANTKLKSLEELNKKMSRVEKEILKKDPSSCLMKQVTIRNGFGETCHYILTTFSFRNSLMTPCALTKVYL